MADGVTASHLQPTRFATQPHLAPAKPTPAQTAGQDAVALPGPAHATVNLPATPKTKAIPMIQLTDDASPKSAALVVKAFEGDSGFLQGIIKHTVGVNVQSEPGMTPLMYEAFNGNSHAVKGLIDAGAYVNTIDKSGTTPLLLAIHSGDLESVKALVKAGADVNHANNKGLTPLGQAVKEGHKDIAQALEGAGAVAPNML